MTTDPVSYDLDEGVAHIRLNRPDSGNALTLETAGALQAAFQAAANDDEAHVVTLSASGRMFCVGGDLRSMSDAQDRGALVLELAHAAHSAVRAMARLKKPIVTAVHGPAAGAGVSLVLLSDVVIADSAASFVTAYTTVGLTPDCGQSWLLPRAVGVSRSLDLILNSPRLAATDAERIGLVSEVVETGSYTRVRALAASMASKPWHALGAARSLVRRGMMVGFDEHLDHEAAEISRMASTRATGDLIDRFVGRGGG